MEERNHPATRCPFLLSLIAVAASGVALHAQIYELDSTFAPVLRDETVIPLFFERDDGELWVAGVTFLDGQRVDGMARYRADGTLRDVLALTDPESNTPLSVGQIVRTGATTVVQSGDRLWRILSNDTLDPQAVISQLHSFATLYPQPDGGILIAGSGYLGESPAPLVTWDRAARLGPDGAFDPSFPDPLGPVLAVDAAGRAYIEVEKQVRRLLPSGQPDATWNSPTLSSSVRLAAVDPNGGLVVLLWSGPEVILRLGATGAIDPGFQLVVSDPGVLSVAASRLRVLADGRVLISTGQYPFESGGVIRLLSNGQADATFVTAAEVGAGVGFWGARAIVVRADNKARPALAGRLEEDGALDPGWTPRFGRAGILRALRRDLEGRVLVAGYFDFVDDAPRAGIARFLPDGSLDQTFVTPTGLLPAQGGSHWGFSRINLGQDGSVFLMELRQLPGPGVGVVRWTRLTNTGALHPDPVPVVSGPYGVTAAADGTLYFTRGRIRDESVSPQYSVYVGSELVRRNPGSTVDEILSVAFTETHFQTPSAYQIAFLSAPLIEMMNDARLLVGGGLAAANGRAGLVAPADGAIVPLPFGTENLAPTAPIYGPASITVGGVSRQSVQRVMADATIDTGFAPWPSLGELTFLADDGRDGAIVLRAPFTDDGSYSPPQDVLRLTATGAVDPGLSRSADLVVAAAAAQDGSLFLATADQLERHRLVEQEIAIIDASSTAVVAGRGLTLSATVGVLGSVSWRWQRDGVDLSGATSATLNLPHVRSTDAGTYRAIATMDGGEIISNAKVITVIPSTARLINLSGRSLVSAQDAQQIAGFYLAEEAEVIVRAVGPSLDGLGVDAPLLDPTIELRRGQTLVGTNTRWAGTDELAQAFLRVGAFPLPNTSADSALRQTLPAGGYTAKVSGTSDGIGLAEIYLDDSDAGTPLINLSLRSYTGAGEANVIAGFFVAGEGPQRLLIRAVGPGLSGKGVAGVAQDPQLKIYRGNVVIAENDDVTAEALAAEAESGAFALSPNAGDAGLVVHLEAGGYTAVVGGDPGIVLVEVYALPAL